MTRRGILGMMVACLAPWRKLFPVRIQTMQGLEALEGQSAIAWLHENGAYFHTERRLEMLDYQRYVLRALDEGRPLTVTLPCRHGKSFITPQVHGWRRSCPTSREPRTS